MLSSLLQEVSDKSLRQASRGRLKPLLVLKVLGLALPEEKRFYRKPGTARRTRDSRRTYKFRDKKRAFISEGRVLNVPNRV